jgi:exodeoxyribonuclease VII small subunit
MAKKKKRDETTGSGSVSDSPVDFESAIAEVEKVVQQLESGELGLSESLAQYERGIEKIKHCHQVLERAEQRIAVLTGVDEDGTASIEPVQRGVRRGSPAPNVEPPEKGVQKKNRPPISDVDDPAGLF